MKCETKVLSICVLSLGAKSKVDGVVSTKI